MVNLDVLFVPIVVGILVCLMRTMKFEVGGYCLKFLRKYSMNIWFLHCIFFNCAKEIIQPIGYWLNNLVLVVVWVLASCGVVSWGIETGKEKVRCRGNKN